MVRGRGRRGVDDKFRKLSMPSKFNLKSHGTYQFRIELRIEYFLSQLKCQVPRDLKLNFDDTRVTKVF